jgi:peptide/nickel transport system ATP-binding protein
VEITVSSLLEVSGLKVSLRTDAGFKALLNGVDLVVAAGETVGVVGESGSGKTMLLRALLGLLEDPFRIEEGSVRFRGEDLTQKSERELRAIRGKDIALTTPEARKHFNPLLPIGTQIARIVQAHRRASWEAALARAVELLRAVGIPDPETRLAAYPHEMSGGMCQRVIIAMALAHSPKLLLADEPTAGLDVTISRQILDLMAELVREAHSSLLVVSRDLGVIAHYCRRVAVMYAGEIVEFADVPAFFERPVHPYSRHLVQAASASRDRRSGASTESLLHPAAESGCRYMPRCPYALPACEQQAPSLAPFAPGHAVRCLRMDELAGDTANTKGAAQ